MITRPKHTILILTMLLAASLRLPYLGVNPIHLTPDETALGYNAYSILKTGRDEYGQWFPLVFKSFGDYKPGLYVYTAVPFIAVFGLNEFSIRLPGALSGLLAILLIYQLANQISGKKDSSLGKISALILAVSPWHVHLSRGAWESNLSLTLTLLAIHFFLNGSKNFKYYYLSTLFFGMTFWAYQGAKLSTPLVILSLLIAFSRDILKRTSLIKPFLLLLIFVLPIILSLKSGSGRLRVFSLFAYRRSPSEIFQILGQDNQLKNDLTYLAFHSEPLYLTRVFLSHYFNYFSSKFLFFEGDWTTTRHTPPYHGVMYVIDAVFLIFGLAKLINSTPPGHKFIIYWLVTAPLPAAFSRDTIQAVRSLNFVIPLVLITSFGIATLFQYLKNRRKILIAVGAIYSLLIFRFLDLEFIHGPILQAKYWYYGYKQVIKAISPIESNYQKIIFNQSYAQPYIYFLFYNKYDPKKWWPQARLQENPNGDVGLVEKLDKIEFRPLAWSGDKYLPKTIIIGDPLAMDPNAKFQNDVQLLKEINYPDGTTAFYIFASKNN